MLVQESVECRGNETHDEIEVDHAALIGDSRRGVHDVGLPGHIVPANITTKGD